jgi:glycosyltransferase involved in cell wall biosynthesis
LLSALVHVNVTAILAARLAGQKTLVIASERNTISQNITAVSSPAIWLAHRLVPWLYPWADGIVAVSRGVAEDLARYSGVSLDRVDIVNNPVVTPELYRLVNEPVDHPWFGRGNIPVILGVGRLAPQKDFGALVKAFAEVRIHRAARLVIVGEGPERNELERLARELGVYDDFSLPGFCRNPYALMARSAMLVLSSRWEGSPNVLVEAMACGTPVVSTDCPHGPAETLQGGRFGALVPVGDVSALAAAIAQTLDNPLAAEPLRQRARDFTVERSVEQYLQVLFRKVNR